VIWKTVGMIFDGLKRSMKRKQITVSVILVMTVPGTPIVGTGSMPERDWADRNTKK